MLENESDYIKRINEMQAEIDEDNDLLTRALAKMKDMEVQIALSKSGFVKSNVSAKQVKAYEDKIYELEQCVELFSIESLSSKGGEVETYLKRLIKIKADLASLAGAKRLKSCRVEEIEDNLVNLEQDMVIKYTSIIQTIQTLAESANVQGKSQTDLIEDYHRLVGYANSVNNILGVIPDILRHRMTEINALKKQVESQRRDMFEFSGNGDTLESLRKQLKSRDLEVAAYKTKVAGLEYEIRSLKSTKSDKKG